MRDQPGFTAVGTAALGGTVIDDATSQPVRRATVTLNGTAGTRTTVTDDNGNFMFAALPAGRYMVWSQKRGYVNLQYGARKAGFIGQGTEIPLAEGERKTDLVLRMPHGGAISGNVTDPNGRPLQSVRVTILEYRYVNGVRTLTQAFGSAGSGGITDDRGTFRIFGLAAGEYVVSAIPTNGQLQDVRPITPADIQWAQQQVRSSQGGSGSSTMSGPPGSEADPPPQAQPVGYAPVFYPGTPDSGSAGTITLAAGEERVAIDFSLQYVPTAKIDGIVVDSAGRPAREVLLVMERAGQPMGAGSDVYIRPTGDGRFSGTGIPPGQYTISARSNPGPQHPSAPDGMPAAQPPSEPEATGTMWASIDIGVDGHDINDIVLTLQPGMVASGRVSFETSRPQSQPPATARVSMNPVGPGSGLPASSASASIRSDGTFSLTGLTPGTYRLSASTSLGRGGAAPGLLLKSVMLNGRDVTDRVITVRPSDTLDDILITLSDRPAELSGKLLDARGSPATEYTIVLFTADRSFWGLGSRRTAQARPQPDGSYRISSLPPGEYYVSAVVQVDSNDFTDPTFFEQLIDASFKITLAEGEKRVQDLRLAGR